LFFQVVNLSLFFALSVKVTLVHSGERLIEFLGPKAPEKTLKWLKSKNVEVILNDRYKANIPLQIYGLSRSLSLRGGGLLGGLDG
jgi:hypothetical protein